MIKFIVSGIVILTFSCTVPERYIPLSTPGQRQERPKPPERTAWAATDSSGIRFTGGDGSSMENALIIMGAKNELEAIPAEINYISGKLGERDKYWKMVMQNNFLINGKPYVEYQIEDHINGGKTSYFFDNSALYSAYLRTTAPSLTQKQQQKETSLPDQTAEASAENSVIRFIGGDGSSMEKAIIIRGAKNEKEGLAAEIDYICRQHGERDKYWKMITQGNYRENGVPYVQYWIEDFKTGSKPMYYFDNTALYSAVPEVIAPSPTPKQQEEAPLPTQTAGVTTEGQGIIFTGGDGSSMEKAIVIRGAKNEKEGLAAEIDYICRKHGEKDKYWKMITQGNYRENGVPYVQYWIEDYKTGSKPMYYFDNTAISGK
jgi:hypothetical protein